MSRSHKGPTPTKPTALPRMRPSEKDPSVQWRKNRGTSTPNSGAVESRRKAAEARLPKLPKLHRDGTGLTIPLLDKSLIVKELAKEAAEAPVPAAPTKDELGEVEALNFRGKGPLSLEEKVLILEHKFSKGWGEARIARLVKRDKRTIVEFVNRYRSTSALARAHFEHEAEVLAKRITKKANVDQSLEILDRLDVLPVKDRKAKESGAPQFNIIVGTPGQAVPASVPDQKTIEAAVIRKA